MNGITRIFTFFAVLFATLGLGAVLLVSPLDIKLLWGLLFASQACFAAAHYPWSA